MLSPNFPKWNIHILHDCRGLHGKCMEMLIVLLQKKNKPPSLPTPPRALTCPCPAPRDGHVWLFGARWVGHNAKKRCTILIYPGQSEEPRTGHFQIAHHSMVKVIVECCSQGVQLSGNRSFTRPHIPNWWWIKNRVNYSSKSSQLWYVLHPHYDSIEIPGRIYSVKFMVQSSVCCSEKIKRLAVLHPQVSLKFHPTTSKFMCVYMRVSIAMGVPP